MTNYLVAPNGDVKFADSSYRGRIKLSEGDFFVNFQSLTLVREEKNWLVSNKYYDFISAAEKLAFHATLAEWRSNSLILYRGFPTCHFCWPSLVNGRLVSEGDVDYPTYTMGGDQTSWLPSDNLVMAQSVANSCNDRITEAKSMLEPIATAVVVSIRCGIGSGRAICWLNNGEIVVRGPLEMGQYRMHSILWKYSGFSDWRLWPRELNAVPILPPARPFQPASALQIDTWWINCQEWAECIGVFDAELANRRRQARERPAIQGV